MCAVEPAIEDPRTPVPLFCCTDPCPMRRRPILSPPCRCACPGCRCLAHGAAVRGLGTPRARARARTWPPHPHLAHTPGHPHAHRVTAVPSRAWNARASRARPLSRSPALLCLDLAKLGPRFAGKDPPRLREPPPFCPAELTTGLLVHAVVALSKLTRRHGHPMRAPCADARTGARSRAFVLLAAKSPTSPCIAPGTQSPPPVHTRPPCPRKIPVAVATGGSPQLSPPPGTVVVDHGRKKKKGRRKGRKEEWAANAEAGPVREPACKPLHEPA